MVDLNLEKLQAYSKLNFGVDWPAGLRAASGINREPNGISQQLYGVDLNGAAEQLYSLIGARGMYVSTASSNAWVDTPDAVSLDILGDIDLRIEYEWDGGNGQNQALISKHGGAGQTSFEWRIALNSAHQFFWSADGTALPGVVDMTRGGGAGDIGQRAISRVTMDVDDGAGNRVIRYYYSTGDIANGPWVQTDVDTIAGVTSIFNSTAVLRLGNRSTGGTQFNGHIFRAQAYNGINGTLVANPDMRFLAPGTTSFVDSTGKTWTFGSGAVIL